MENTNNTNNVKKEKIITMKTKVFQHEKTPRLHSILVDAVGRVWVLDSVAGHYTTCHSMSERSRAIARARAHALD